MRAAQLLKGNIDVVDIEEGPGPAAGQIRLEVVACGICGSDLSLYSDADRFTSIARQGGFVYAAFDPTHPVVPGHEYAGRVTEVGDGVTEVSVGDRVAGLGVATDPSTGAPTVIGFSNEYPGGLSESIVVDAMWVRRIPDNLSFNAATLAEPLHVGETHVKSSGIPADQSAVVIGAGPIGLGVVAALVARGCADLTVVEPSPARREAATKLGATRVLSPDEEDPVASSSAPVYVYECSGRQGAIAKLAETAPWGSHIQVAASSFKEEPLIPAIAQWHQLVINFSAGSVEDDLVAYGLTMQRLSTGEIDPDAVISNCIALSDVSEAFSALKSPKDNVKIVVNP